MSTKTTTPDTKPQEGAAVPPAEEPKKEVMGIERDDTNCRISFTTDGNLLIITMPIGRMPRALAHGFVYELHQVVSDWYAERKKSKIITRDEASRFSFKAGISKLLRG